MNNKVREYETLTEKKSVINPVKLDSREIKKGMEIPVKFSALLTHKNEILSLNGQLNVTLHSYGIHHVALHVERT